MVKKTNNDAQNIQIKLKIESHEKPHKNTHIPYHNPGITHS